MGSWRLPHLSQIRYDPFDVSHGPPRDGRVAPGEGGEVADEGEFRFWIHSVRNGPVIGIVTLVTELSNHQVMNHWHPAGDLVRLAAEAGTTVDALDLTEGEWTLTMQNELKRVG